LGVINNVINTLFKSSGTASVVKDTESIGRAQTRLGQASASAGRSFAAQSQGLGGLVGAYAGAAATVFALEAAFMALSKAAQSETILQGTATLASEIGQSGPEILKTIQGITQGQLTLTESAQNANIALSAGFNVTQIEGFTEVALKASRALGRDLTDSLQRVIRGVSKLEPELLDEIGIFTRIDPAVAKYARQLGVSTTSLNEFQRRQAFANAAIEEGIRKFGNIDTTSGSAQKTLEQLRVKVSELSIEFTKLLVNVLSPIAEFFTDDIGNALLLFGGILTLVFSKAISMIGAWSKSSIQNISAFASNLATNAAAAKGSFDIIKKGAEEAKAAVAGRGGLSQLDGKFNQPGIKRDTATEAAQARQRFLKGEQLSTAQINADIASLTKAQTELAAAGKQNSAAYTDASKIIGTYSTALQTAGLRTRILTSLSAGLAVAARLAATAFTVFTTALNGILFVVGAAQLIGTLFDVDLLAEVKKLFTDTSKVAANLAAGIAGLTVSAAGGTAELVRQLELAGATEPDLENLPKTINKLQKEIDSITTVKLQQELTNGMAGFTRSPSTTALNVVITDAERLATIEGEISRTRAIIAKGPTFFIGDRAIEEAKQRLIVLESLQDSIATFGTAYGKVVGELSSVTGVAAEAIATTLTTGFENTIQQAQNKLTVFGVEVSMIDGQLSLESLSAEQRGIVESGVSATNTITNLNESLRAGAIDSDKLGASIGGLQNQADKITVAYNSQSAAIQAVGGASIEAVNANRELGNSLNALNTRISTLITIQKELLNIERVFKSVSKVFSSEISLFENVEASGIINTLGEVANSQKEIDKNQASYLTNILEATKASAILVTSQEATNKALDAANLSGEERLIVESRIRAEAELYNKTMEAVNGKIVSIIQSAQKLTEDFSQATAEIRREIDNINADTVLFKLEAAIDVNKLKRDLALAQQEAKLEAIRTEIQLVSAKEKAGAISPLEAARQTSVLEQEVLNQRRALIDLEYQNAIQAITEENELLFKKLEASKLDILAQAQLQKDKIASDAALIQALISTYSAFIADQKSVAELLSSGFVSAGNAVSEALALTLSRSALALATAVTTGQAIDVSAGVAVATPIEDVTNRLSEVGTELESVTAAYLKSIDDKSAAEIKAAEAVFNAGINDNTEKLEAERVAHENKLAQLGKETEIESYNALSREAQSASANDKLTEVQEKLQQLFDSIKGNIENALMSINNLVFYGEGNLGDIFSNLFKSIQQDFFKTTIADPLSGFLTDSLFSVLGVTGMRTGIENAKVVGGALLVSVVSGPADMLNALGGDPTAAAATGATGIFGGFFEGISSLFGKVFGQGGIIANLFSGLFGQGGILSGLFNGIFGGLGGGVGLAQGGMVHLAQGGAAISASLSRDRVPAMLEPGEFVLRKQSARKIGMPALQAMNATGTAGGTGNVSINVTNEGSPKQADASPPRFDGEKYVVDVIMRDISNNGPIRRSLRGRGGI
jgi:hypothetical protein